MVRVGLGHERPGAEASAREGSGREFPSTAAPDSGRGRGARVKEPSDVLFLLYLLLPSPSVRAAAGGHKAPVRRRARHPIWWRSSTGGLGRECPGVAAPALVVRRGRPPARRCNGAGVRMLPSIDLCRTEARCEGSNGGASSTEEVQPPSIRPSENALPSSWYEALLVLHLMAKGFLEYAIQHVLPRQCQKKHVLPRISPENRKGLPVDLSEGVLKAICMQALGQVCDPLWVNHCIAFTCCSHNSWHVSTGYYKNSFVKVHFCSHSDSTDLLQEKKPIRLLQW